MAKFPLLPGVDSLTVLVDNDKSAGRQMRERARFAGFWQVVKHLLTPREVGSDASDWVGGLG